MTDFEKLLFAQAAIKEFKKTHQILEIELGKANARIEELKYIINQDKDLATIRSLKGENKKWREENRLLRGKIKELKESKP